MELVDVVVGMNGFGQLSSDNDDVGPTHTASLEYPLVNVEPPGGISAADALEALYSKNWGTGPISDVIWRRQLLTPHLGIPNAAKFSCHPRSSCDAGGMMLKNGLIPHTARCQIGLYI